MATRDMNGSEVERAIRDLDQEFTKRIVARDNEGLALEFYTADAYIVARRSPLSKGRRAVNAFWREFLLKDVLRLTLMPDHIEVSGRLAFSVGTYTLRTTESLETGKYLVVYRQSEDGMWARAAESFSSEE